MANWEDQSGNARHAAQVTEANKPTYRTNVLNGKPVVRFDGVNDLLVIAHALGLSGEDVPFTVIVVGSSTTPADNEAFWSVASTAGTTPVHALMYASTIGLRAFRRSDANVTLNADGGTASSAARVISHVFAGTTGSLWINGVSTVAAAAMDVGPLTLNETVIGAFRGTSTPANFLSGDIAEVLVYARALTAAERRDVERYLGLKYGIAATT